MDYQQEDQQEDQQRDEATSNLLLYNTEELPTMLWADLGHEEVEGHLFRGVHINDHVYLIENGARRRVLNADYLALVQKIEVFQAKLRAEGIDDREDLLVRSIGDDFIWGRIPAGPPIL